MLLLSKSDIKKIFSMEDAIGAVEGAFKLFSSGGSEVPLRTVINNEKANGNFLFMPAYADSLEASSIKIVNIFPDNASKGLPTAPATVVLIDGKTGIIESIIDGTYCTQLRTGAASGVAFKYLARKDSEYGALIGVGSQAECQLEAMIVANNLKEVKVYSRRFEKTKAFVEKMQEELGSYKTLITPVETSDEAVENADVITLVTSSTSPVFDASKVKNGATISAVGSYQYHMQEVDPEIFKRTSKIYFDSTEAVLSESGDILKPLEDGILKEKDFTGEIGQVIMGNLVARESEDEIILFKTVGIGTQDLATAKAIYDKAQKLGVGTVWS
ncbi:MAG: ornithine cyclodeaminase family protein [Tissierellia bacterium]|nr:ornithine cyclodeaminase family protein [Tissierellia bacterium]